MRLIIYLVIVAFAFLMGEQNGWNGGYEWGKQVGAKEKVCEEKK